MVQNHLFHPSHSQELGSGNKTQLGIIVVSNRARSNPLRMAVDIQCEGNARKRAQTPSRLIPTELPVMIKIFMMEFDELAPMVRMMAMPFDFVINQHDLSWK